jgi:hypothetical protein
MSGGFVGFIASAIFKGFHGWREIAQAIVISALSALGAFVITFFVSLVKAPKLLDDQRLSEIKTRDEANQTIRETFATTSADLRSQIDDLSALNAARNAEQEELKKPKRSASEEQKFADVEAALEELGPIAITVLRYLDRIGKWIYNDSGTPFPPTPNGMSARDMKACLETCVFRVLVTRETIQKPTGGIYPIQEHTFQIAPGIKPVLDDLLYRPTSS